MRHRTHTVFDDYIAIAGEAFTDSRHNTLLGEHDMLALHALVDNVTTPDHVDGAVDIYVMHSSEGRNWLYRRANQVTLPSSSDITVAAAADGLRHRMWSDACLGAVETGPLLSFVRLHIICSAGVGAHVKIHATLRGSGFNR